MDIYGSLEEGTREVSALHTVLLVQLTSKPRKVSFPGEGREMVLFYDFANRSISQRACV